MSIHKVPYVFGLAVLLVTLSIAKEPSDPYRVRWSPALKLKSISDIDARLHRSFGDVFEGTVHGQPVTIRNCGDYLANAREGFAVTGGELAAKVLRADAVDCVALEALRSARPAATSYLREFQLNSAALAKLSPILAPAVSNEKIAEARHAAEEGESWRQFVPAAHAKPLLKPGVLDVTQPDWDATITEYGRGDFNGDGVDDLLVRADYAATKGTYRNARLFLLSRKSEAGILEVIKEYTIP